MTRKTSPDGHQLVAYLTAASGQEETLAPAPELPGAPPAELWEREQ